MKRSLWSLLVLVLLGVVAAFVYTQKPPHPLPVYGKVPDFALTGKDGQILKRSDLEGKTWIADFIFTRCQGQCPLMSQRMAKLQQDLPDGLDLRLVSISVDPSWDTPEVLSRYALEYEADPRWLFLTGDKEKIYTLARKGFLLGVEEAGGTKAEPIIHSNRFVLVDGQAQIRGIYEGTDEGALKKLERDASLLLKEGK